MLTKIFILACPMCADLVEKGRLALENWRFAEAANASVVFMLAAPFMILATLCFLIWKDGRRLRKPRRHTIHNA